MFKHNDHDGHHQLVLQADGRFRHEVETPYHAPRVSFLTADQAYRLLRHWRVSEQEITACRGLEGFARIDGAS